MRVFISWSGPRSGQLSEAIEWLLRRTIQAAKPWRSQTDLPAGAVWPTPLFSTLADTDVGVLCITNESVTAPWLLFEAGALVCRLNKETVVPYLLDFKADQLPDPLRLLNAVTCDKAGTARMLQAINARLDQTAISDTLLRELLDTWWGEFEKKLQAIPGSQESSPPARDADARIASIESIVRQIAAVVLEEQGSTEMKVREFQMRHWDLRQEIVRMEMELNRLNTMPVTKEREAAMMVAAMHLANLRDEEKRMREGLR